MKITTKLSLRVKSYWSKQEGFTLLELIAVIAILGIIAAISFTAFSTQGEKARISAHQTNVLTIEQAAERYNVEKGFKTGSGASTEDFTEIDAEHSLVKEGYLKEEPKNPWASTNADQKNYKYIITKDKRGIFSAYLAELSGSNVVKYIEIDEKDNKVEYANQGAELNFTSNDIDENSSLSDRYFVGK